MLKNELLKFLISNGPSVTKSNGLNVSLEDTVVNSSQDVKFLGLLLLGDKLITKNVEKQAKSHIWLKVFFQILKTTMNIKVFISAYYSKMYLILCPILGK